MTISGVSSASSAPQHSAANTAAKPAKHQHAHKSGGEGAKTAAAAPPKSAAPPPASGKVNKTA